LIGEDVDMTHLLVAVPLAIAAITLGSLAAALPIAAAERNQSGSPDRAVTVARAKEMCFPDTIQVTGVLVAKDEVLVRPDKEGLKISQVLVEPGDNVTTGQVLARLTQDGSQGGAGATTLTAPAAGTVNAVLAVIGAPASPRADPLFRIARQGELELLAETPVHSLARLAADQRAKIEIIGVGELNGKVRLLSSTVNPTTQLGNVRLSIAANPKLRVGAFGRGIVEVTRRCGPSVPFSAVSYETEGTVVQVVRDNQIESRRVTVGLIAAGDVEVREGLAAGDVVVARAGAFVRDGDRVRPVTGSADTVRR
jgi:multidrug efflux pump subunit AcrA (membrane-fusion protein)